MRYHDLQAALRHVPAQLQQVRKAAVRAVLARARAVIGASKKETRKVTSSLSLHPHGELNIEQTLENALTKPVIDSTDIIVDLKEQKRLDCALMLDTSLSMTGKKLALLAVAAAVLAYKLPSQDFAIISFESTASTLKKMRTTMPIEMVVTKILQVPAVGYTNIEAALQEGLRQLARGRQKRRVGILLSDGKYTAGSSPLPVASEYRNLHVVLLGDFNTDPAACAALASTGHGMFYKASSFDSLPRTLNRLVADLLM